MYGESNMETFITIWKIAIYFPYGNVSFHVTLYTSHPLLPSPHVHKSILYVCLSIAAL